LFFQLKGNKWRAVAQLEDLVQRAALFASSRAECASGIEFKSFRSRGGEISSCLWLRDETLYSQFRSSSLSSTAKEMILSPSVQIFSASKIR